VVSYFFDKHGIMMAGHGSPSASRSRRLVSRFFFAWRSGGGRIGAFIFALLIDCAVAMAASGDVSMRVRISWSGGPDRVWQGGIALSAGTLAELTPLGDEADEAGTMWIERSSADLRNLRGDRSDKRVAKSAEGYVVIRQSQPRHYSGVDLLVTAPLEASLFVELYPAENGKTSQPPGWVEIRLADILHGSASHDLDDRGNRLSARRAPGDDLRLRIYRPSLVFAPGETLRCELQPNLLPLENGAKARLKIQLFPGRSSRVLWEEEHAFVTGENVTVPLDVPLSRDEGVYDITFTVSPAGRFWLQNSVRSSWATKPIEIERSVQVVVLQSRASSPPAKGREALALVDEIDPANPKWSGLKLGRLPRWQRIGKSVLANGDSKTIAHPLGQLTALSPSSKPNGASWEAYVLQLHRPGEPHVLEIDYPSDVAQTMSVSIVEPNASGSMTAAALDTGIDRAEEVVASGVTPQWLHHRIVFWPRSKTPVVLIANLRSDATAVFGRIRLSSGWQRLPRAYAPGSSSSQRLFAAYMDRPMFARNFCASEAPGGAHDSNICDWVTFYDGGSRLTDYLQHVGYNGLILSVLADGSTIYPSQAIPSTPRHDNGLFFATGQDPVRKDVLEMLFRLFDRESMQLTPALEFASPLPELDAALRRGGPAAEGIEWIGAEGLPWTRVHSPQAGRAPYYNVFHPRVQEAMLSAVREVATNYGRHPAFGGLALQLSGFGYAQLPGPEWGLDDVTVALFERDTKIQLTGEGPNRFAQRAQALTYVTSDGQHQWRREWLEWRAAQLAKFYRRVLAEIQAVHPDAKLYLAGAELFSGEELSQGLRPALPRRLTLTDMLLRVGIDPREYAGDNPIVLMRPERIASQATLAGRPAELELAQMPDFDRAFQGLAHPACLFYHRPQELRIASFDERSPFRPCAAPLIPQPTPSSWQNRRRFIHALASLDAQTMIDGGWLLSMGQEDSLRDMITVFRQLPAARMEKAAEAAGEPSSQPVFVRFGTQGNRTCAYMVNDSAFEVKARVRVAAPTGCRIEGVVGSRAVGALAYDVDGAYWETDLGPYELAAVTFSSPGVKLYASRAVVPEDVRLSLERKIAQMADQFAALRTPPPWDAVANASFDRQGTGQDSVPNWTKMTPSGVKINLDTTTKYDGPQSLHLQSNGPTGGVASAPFPSPSTGRLAVRVWLRTADPAKQPPFRVAIERIGGHSALSYAQFGRPGEDQPEPPPVADQWNEFVVHVTDLPIGTKIPIRVRLELMGPGEVWVDNLQMSSFSFSEREQKELFRLIAPAEWKLQSGQVTDCIRLLEGYWPRYLANHVEAPQQVASHAIPEFRTPPSEPAAAAKESDRAGLMDRVRGLVPNPLRF
jgi:hypothetical protein